MTIIAAMLLAAALLVVVGVPLAAAGLIRWRRAVAVVATVALIGVVAGAYAAFRPDLGLGGPARGSEEGELFFVVTGIGSAAYLFLICSLFGLYEGAPVDVSPERGFLVDVRGEPCDSSSGQHARPSAQDGASNATDHTGSVVASSELAKQRAEEDDAGDQLAEPGAELLAPLVGVEPNRGGGDDGR